MIIFLLNHILCRLSVIVMKDEEVALRAAILFCFNPASVFYSSVYPLVPFFSYRRIAWIWVMMLFISCRYSESLFAVLSIGGLYHFMNGKYNYATLWLALSGCARSNGVLNAGYVCYHAMKQLNEAFSSRKCSYVSTHLNRLPLWSYKKSTSLN